MVVPDSLKQALSAQDEANSLLQGTSEPAERSTADSAASVLASPAASRLTSRPAVVAGTDLPDTQNRGLAFDSERRYPTSRAARPGNRRWYPVDVPVGFDFSFHGNSLQQAQRVLERLRHVWACGEGSRRFLSWRRDCFVRQSEQPHRVRVDGLVAPGPTGRQYATKRVERRPIADSFSSTTTSRSTIRPAG